MNKWLKISIAVVLSLTAFLVSVGFYLYYIPPFNEGTCFLIDVNAIDGESSYVEDNRKFIIIENTPKESMSMVATEAQTMFGDIWVSGPILFTELRMTKTKVVDCENFK